MATIQIERIKNALRSHFEQHIDLTDLQNRTTEQREQCFLSRALAAYAIQLLSSISDKDSASAVTDGFDDLGIDAIYFDRTEHVLYVVQSKWKTGGTGSIQHGECLKFIEGLRRLINLRLDGFNNKVREKEGDVRDALHDSKTRITLVIAYTGTQSLSEVVKSEFDRFLKLENDPAELIFLEVLDLAGLYAGVTGGVRHSSITETLMVKEWGLISDPFVGYYGQIGAEVLAGLWQKHQGKLFAGNIRHFRGSTDVNLAVESTLRDQPDRFWYLNNGVTIVCDSIEKLPVGGSSRENGIFECRGISVVNGAQTVGVIGRLAEQSVLSDQARVLVRLISLENCPRGFDKIVARATNTQNQIGSRDFAALDPNQQRLASEMLLDGRSYAYKTGEPEPPADKGCSIVEATVALACALRDVALAVQAKREIGRLWENIEIEPYTLLFNDATGAVELWHAVGIMRCVDKQLLALRPSSLPRAAFVAVHGNRLILHRVFQDPRVRQFRSATDDEFSAISRIVPEIVVSVFERMIRYLEDKYQWAYLASLFKNQSKCRDVDNWLVRTEGSTSAPAPSQAHGAQAAPISFSVRDQPSAMVQSGSGGSWPVER